MKPLADKIRPNKLEDFVGQKHLLSEGMVLRNIIESGRITNMIFYGPPGVGKTSIANLIAKKSKKNFYKLNATNASLSDIKDIVNDLDNLLNVNGIILYLDEIQNFNKKQQQSLLEFMENGKITLIASTTENPFQCIYKAILSRASIFEFKPLEVEDIEKALKRAVSICKNDLENIKINISDEDYRNIAMLSDGDVRRAINLIELCIFSTKISKNSEININKSVIQNCCQTKTLNYDFDGDSHYDILSAFQKSIRGSDTDASLHYLARLIKAGDLKSICRRLLVIAAEDIGLAYPSAINIVKSCVDSALMLGFPEARIPLSEAVILLSTSPKSNSCIKAIDNALFDLDNEYIGEIPTHIRDGHYSGAKELQRMQNYKYPHDYKNNYVEQNYLPDSIKDKIYYKAGQNKFEQNAKIYWDKIKKNS